MFIYEYHTGELIALELPNIHLLNEVEEIEEAYFDEEIDPSTLSEETQSELKKNIVSETMLVKLEEAMITMQAIVEEISGIKVSVTAESEVN